MVILLVYDKPSVNIDVINMSIVLCKGTAFSFKSKTGNPDHEHILSFLYVFYPACYLVGKYAGYVAHAERE